jgi:hypothetical protein
MAKKKPKQKASYTAPACKPSHKTKKVTPKPADQPDLEVARTPRLRPAVFDDGDLSVNEEEEQALIQEEEEEEEEGKVGGEQDQDQDRGQDGAE